MRRSDRLSYQEIVALHILLYWTTILVSTIKIMKLNELRQKFVISHLRHFLKTVRKSCQHCKIQFATPNIPSMADLPECRLAAFTRPFTYVGVDCFGPIQVAVGRRLEKRWGMLFTCMTIRAIHIEIAYCLNVDSCLMCLRNFISRRGMPLEIFSDMVQIFMVLTTFFNYH